MIEARSDAIRAILHRNMECWVLESSKLDVVIRINIDILGIGELKWVRMGKFNSVQFSLVAQLCLTL